MLYRTARTKVLLGTALVWSGVGLRSRCVAATVTPRLPDASSGTSGVNLVVMMWASLPEYFSERLLSAGLHASTRTPALLCGQGPLSFAVHPLWCVSTPTLRPQAYLFLSFILLQTKGPPSLMGDMGEGLNGFHGGCVSLPQLKCLSTHALGPVLLPTCPQQMEAFVSRESREDAPGRFEGGCPGSLLCAPPVSLPSP